MRSKRYVPFLCATVMLAWLPRGASAQGFINPFVGSTLTSPSTLSGRSQPGFGVAFGSVGLIFGGEAEIAYYPEVLDSDPNSVDRSRALTISGSTFIGPRIGPVKVYGAFGVGDTILSATPATIFNPTGASISNHYFTLNAGGGVMIFLSKHVGVRGDLRSFRAYGVKSADFPIGNASVDQFKFWRATGGLAFRF